ncbi:MAG: lytic transglycosylase [Magnetococcus sp. MYC-9]
MRILHRASVSSAGRLLVGLCLSGWLLGGCGSLPTADDRLHISQININDACAIFQGRRSWYQVMDKAYQKWGTPVPVQLAIIHQESRFRSDARPLSKGKMLGFLPGQRLSSALGYAQALDGTWANYRQQTGNHRADREDFRDAVDFIGWYNHVSYKKLSISKRDARNLYLAYHEGHGGYAAKSYRKKSWLIRVAAKVERNAERYGNQLVRCQDSLTTSNETENNWSIWPF